MNAVELDKCTKNSILPLFPDLTDEPDKCILVKLYSGPGQMNVQMLADLQPQGLCIVPGVPNTAAKMHEMDQNCGPMKSTFCGNPCLLSQARCDKDMNLQVSNLPLLLFEGRGHKTDVVLQDAFTDGFSLDKNQPCWKKCGAIP